MAVIAKLGGYRGVVGVWCVVSKVFKCFHCITLVLRLVVRTRLFIVFNDNRNVD